MRLKQAATYVCMPILILLILIALMFLVPPSGKPATKPVIRSSTSLEVLASRGIDESTQYPATVGIIELTQTKLLGQVFLGSGTIKGLESITILRFSVALDGRDYILEMPIDDITFKQVDGVETTIAFDLKETKKEYLAEMRDGTLVPSDNLEKMSTIDLLKMYFISATITLSHDEYKQLLSNGPP